MMIWREKKNRYKRRNMFGRVDEIRFKVLFCFVCSRYLVRIKERLIISFMRTGCMTIFFTESGNIPRGMLMAKGRM